MPVFALVAWVAFAQTADEPAPSATEQPVVQPAAQNQVPEGITVRSIEFRGLENVTDAYARSLVQTEPGQPYSGATVVEDVRRLERSGKFATAVAVPQVIDGEVELTFEVVERPQIVGIEIDGNVKFKAGELMKELEFTTGDPLDVVAVQQGRANIETRYRQSGYGTVDVSLDEELLRNERIVRYTIVEGPRIKVRKILFEGNHSFVPSTLSSQVSTKTYIWVFRTGAYDPEQVRQDETSLRQFYVDQGFLEARVSHRLEFDDSGENLTIVFIIDEGTQYRIRNLNIEGAQSITQEEIAGRLSLKSGEIFRGDWLRRDIKTVETLYGELGFINAAAQASWVFAADDPGFVDLTLSISEGGQYRVGRVVVRGNSRTKDKVVRREVRLFPEELFDTTAARQSEQRLRETGLFTEARVTAVGEDPEYRDAVVEIVESDDTTKILFGIGVTSDSGVVGNITVENRNFDLFDWPRTFGEFFRGQSFRGAGQTLRLQFEPSTEFTRGRVDFFEPYLLDKPVSLGTSFYLFQRDRDDYEEERLGLSVSFGRRFNEGLLKGWAGEIALRTEWVDISDVSFLAARDIRDAEGGDYISSIKGTLVRDRTDSRFIPTRGDRLKGSWEQFGVMGGDAYFAKAIVSYNWYKTLRTDVFDRKSVLHLRGLSGFIIGDAPVYERFYAGGIGSLRGFEFRTVSPRQGIRDDDVGGEFMLLTGAEYTFPLVGKQLRGVLFTDMGTVEPGVEISDWRVSIGAGLRMYVDFFGPVPLEMDFAIPLATGDGDDEQVFSFFFGTAF